jgi:hypothetical protein
MGVRVSNRAEQHVDFICHELESRLGAKVSFRSSWGRIFQGISR